MTNDLLKRADRIQAGPWYFKMLVSNNIAGALIGKNGASLAQMESSSGAVMRLSSGNVFFPRTVDRVVTIAGTSIQINEILTLIFAKITEEDQSTAEQEITHKIALPNSAVSIIIGKGGAAVKDLTQRTGAKVSVSPRGDIAERIVSVTGVKSDAEAAVREICRSIQEDSSLKEYLATTAESYHDAKDASWTGKVPSYPGYGHPGSSLMMFPQSVREFETHIEIWIPESDVGGVIGKAGYVLKSINRNSGALVHVEAYEDAQTDGIGMYRRVSITGPLECVYNAHGLLVQRLIELSVEESGNYDTWKYGGRYPVESKGKGKGKGKSKGH